MQLTALFTINNSTVEVISITANMDDLVGRVTTFELENKGKIFQFLAGIRYCFNPQRLHIVSVANPASYALGTGCPFSVIKVADQGVKLNIDLHSTMCL